MRLCFSIALIGLAAGGMQVEAQTSFRIAQRDRYFVKYPFDRWQAEGDRAQLRWSVHVRPATLSAHQRMVARIEIEVNAREVAKRRGRGELATLLQIEDSAGKRWRAHNGYDLAQIPKDAKPQSLTHYQDVFLLPGDYTVWIAACDSATGDYSFVRRSLHVAPPRGDTLADSWRDLPPLEFVRPLEAPDAWFQPYVRGRVLLGIKTARPVHVDVVMNMTASDRSAGSLNTFRRNMSILIPALKVLAGMEVPHGSLDVTLLDLTRQRAWEQKAAPGLDRPGLDRPGLDWPGFDWPGLDWKKLRVPLLENQPGVIDAQSLAAKSQMVRFFRDQVLQRACARQSENELRVVIVLSAPAFLRQQQVPEPVVYERDPNRKIFYLRYRPLPARINQNALEGNQPLQPIASSLPSDDLENALKPLDARVLTAQTPEEFRKALSTMLTAIQRM